MLGSSGTLSRSQSRIPLPLNHPYPSPIPCYNIPNITHLNMYKYRVRHKYLPIENVTLLKNDLVFEDVFNI